MKNRLVELLLGIRDFIQFALGDREPVIKRAREKHQRAWDQIYNEELRKMRGATTLGRSGDVVLPLTVWESLGLKPGDRLDFTIKDTKIILTPHSLSAVCSKLPPPDRARSIAEMENAIAQGAIDSAAVNTKD